MALEPGDVVEVCAVRDRDDRPFRPERARLLADRLRDARDGVGARRDQPGDPFVEGSLRLRRRRVGAAVRVLEERVAQVCHPASAGRPRDRRGDQVRRAGRRGREDDVDPVLAHEPDPGGDGGEGPGCVFVGDHEAPQLEPGPRERALDALRLGEHL
jgi:hypothetical protein